MRKLRPHYGKQGRKFLPNVESEASRENIHAVRGKMFPMGTLPLDILIVNIEKKIQQF